MRAVHIEKTGGPEVLSVRDIPIPEPADGTALVRVEVAGINFIDTYYREGIYHSPTPFTLGFEGSGYVEKDPTGTWEPGTRVAWCDGFGSYAEYVTVPAHRLVRVPDSVDSAVAASMLLQGITAHYLTDGVYNLKKGSTCLITAGAGGVGLLATQLATARGATVYSVVGSDEKEKLAYDAGAAAVFRYSHSLAEEVRRHNGGQGVDVVYDGVGKDTFHESLEVVRPRGLVCLFGAASGPVEPIDPQILNTHGSIYLTRPSIGAWTAGEGEFERRATSVVDAVTDGTLTVRVGASYPLDEVAQAHRDLESRATTGSIVLTL